MTVGGRDDNRRSPTTSRVEERWLDTGSGPGRTVRVEVHDRVDENPETAYRRILDHGMNCPTCRTLDEDGRANGDCDTARRLNHAWGTARRRTT
ncbi:hypothetical protein WB401_32930 [Streptomyces brasiliscabiei]|uniref:Transposase n=1 Tax=Streptomyces brasiliscabiei TaxID=2736302 RepID=A0ABU8GP95_9ACTN